MIVWSFLITFAFLGGWDSGLIIFIIKVLLICFLYVAVRASYPRFRFDQLMEIGWDDILMVAFGIFIFIISIIF
jgi:NADH-quinone oxidoreductase subunit H